MNQTTNPQGATSAHRKVSPAKFAHVVLLSSSKQRLLEWYRDVLDGVIAFDSPFVGFVTYDEEHHRVAVATPPNLTESGRPAPGELRSGLHHFAFTYGSLADLIHTYERLKSAGITPEVCTNHGPTLSFYYLDPDGNRAELQIDSFDTVAETAAWFHTDEFIDNPVGVDFDPEVLVADYKRGVPEEELKKRPNIGPRMTP